MVGVFDSLLTQEENLPAFLSNLPVYTSLATKNPYAEVQECELGSAYCFVGMVGSQCK
jgi:hypothetical protein